jgi:hypothetical protein
MIICKNYSQLLDNHVVDLSINLGFESIKFIKASSTNRIKTSGDSGSGGAFLFGGAES